MRAPCIARCNVCRFFPFALSDYIADIGLLFGHSLGHVLLPRVKLRNGVHRGVFMEFYAIACYMGERCLLLWHDSVGFSFSSCYV